MAARRARPPRTVPRARARPAQRVGPTRLRPTGSAAAVRSEADRVLGVALREDATAADRTTHALFPDRGRTVAYVLAERTGVVSGLDAVSRLGRQTGLSVRPTRSDGTRVRPGDRVLELRGDTATILSVERTVLNLLMHLSGVATETRRAVRAAGGAFEVYGTRKTMPGLRHLEKEAIRHGGGVPHRSDLASGILVKNNHLRFVSIPSAVGRLRRSYGRRWPIEVEVRSTREALAAVDAGADALLVDNASPSSARTIVGAARARAGRRRIWVELSGGITIATIGRFGRSGADAVSLGQITHSARALPFHLRFVDTTAPLRRPARHRGRRR